MNHELALNFIFQALRFAELTVNMNHVDWFAEVWVLQAALYCYAYVDIYINLSEVFKYKTF